MKPKHTSIVENHFVEKMLFKNNHNSSSTCELEFTGVIKNILEISNESLRKKFNTFFKLYSQFVEVFGENHGGMSCVDLFSFWYTLDTIKPQLVIENGVFQGGSTWIIRQTLPKARLFCFDPMRPKYLDKTKDELGNELTSYFVGKKFKDFKDVDLTLYGVTQSDFKNCVAFFDCHTNALERLKQSYSLGIKHVLFNDNYPEHCGGHLTLQHIESHTDNRYSTLEERKQYLDFVVSHTSQIVLFPNVVGDRVKTGEGTFTVRCLFKDFNELETKLYHSQPEPELLDNFDKQSLRYRWNTYVKLI